MTKHISDESDVRAATAPFQAEFPYERDEEAQVTRRCEHCTHCLNLLVASKWLCRSHIQTF